MTGRQVIRITSALANLTTKLATCTHKDLNPTEGVLQKGKAAKRLKCFPFEPGSKGLLPLIRFSYRSPELLSSSHVF